MFTSRYLQSFLYSRNLILSFQPFLIRLGDALSFMGTTSSPTRQLCSSKHSREKRGQQVRIDCAMRLLCLWCGYTVQSSTWMAKDACDMTKPGLYYSMETRILRTGPYLPQRRMFRITKQSLNLTEYAGG